MIYLVLEYESGLYYIPFKDLASADEFTRRFNSPLDLCAAINDYLGLGKSREEMLDAYLSESVEKIADDTQEHTKRYLAVKYQRDNYDDLDLEIKFANFIKYNLNKVNKFVGLDKVVKNVRNKYRAGGDLLDRDIERIALAYLGSDYKRRKECFFKLKDLGYKAKINEEHISYSSVEELAQEDMMVLVYMTNMSIAELSGFLLSQDAKGRQR